LSSPRPAAASGHDLRAFYDAVRTRSMQLAAPLSEEDCCAQSMPDASPVKWHLAHTTWFFETFILEPHEPGFRPFDPSFRVLFNSYYNGVGDKHPRAQRGLLTRPPRSRVREYRRNVDERMLELLGRDGPWQDLALLGLHHEQQHQELILTDVKHLLSLHPLSPAYHAAPLVGPALASSPGWIAHDGGIASIGAGQGFCFDNEQPRHEILLRPYLLASRLVTNGEYAAFIEDGGYQDPSLWLSEGWDWVQANAIEHPVYWRREDGSGMEFTLAGQRRLDSNTPVSHVSYFEADAFARWSEARLPTEGEWEQAAAACAIEGHFAESGQFHPCAAAGKGLQQMYGDLWEWTSSSYAPYPGYRPAPGAIGEYNGKFMVNQYVLRGGSCATPRGHVRASYRNFFPTSARWQFSGIRLAKDAA
jgi:ergothioneine biosynthesis protein EgtB